MEKRDYKNIVFNVSKVIFRIVLYSGILGLVCKSIFVFASFSVFLTAMFITFEMNTDSLMKFLIKTTTEKNLDISTYVHNGVHLMDYRNICIIYSKKKFNDIVDLLEKDPSYGPSLLEENKNKKCLIITSDFFPQYILWDTKSFNDQIDF